ncbi:hypothetical protein [Bradyrhizobium sp.]|jgi:hypothetical protein|uniref:hypothetical protein n=1 Tax=Bradyrhizobium sp. TaxID=376 RepID=UPI002DFBB282|nr:hypothetical protein [Bradyrhizobium sp.]
MSAPSDRNDRPAKPARDGGRDEAASHIAEAVRDLAQLARRHKHDTLGFLLDMALMEAEEIVRLRGKPASPKS